MQRIRGGVLLGALLLLSPEVMRAGVPGTGPQQTVAGPAPATEEARLRATLAERPDDVTAMEQLADLLEHSGRSHAALRLRQQAVARSGPGAAERQAQLQLAVSLVEAGQYDAALPPLRTVIAEDPSNEPAQYEMGTLLARRDEFAKAYAAFARAVTLRPTDAEAQLSAAKALVTLVRYADAAPYLEAAGKFGADPEQVHLLRGLVEAHTGKEAEAAGEFRAALQLNPGDTEARLGLGDVLRQQGDFAEATRQLEMVAATQPSVSVEFQLVKLYRQLGKTDLEQQAAEALKRLEDQRANDTKVEVLRRQAEAAEQAGDHAKAATGYREALSLRPADGELLYRLALISGEMGDQDKKRALLEQAVGGKQPPVGALVELGTMQAAGGDRAAAAQAYRRALTMDPQRPDALSNLAVLLAQAGDLPGAEHLLRSAMESDPTYAAAYRDLGLIDAAAGQPTEAEATLRRGMELAPKDASLPLTLGRIYLAEHRPEDAAVQFRLATRMAPGDVTAGVLLAQSLADTGAVHEALDQIQAVLQLAPTQAEALQQRARLCEEPQVAHLPDFHQLCPAGAAP